MTGTPSSSSRELARQLIARETAGADNPDAVAAAMQRLCARVSNSLRRTVGDDGYNALLARALAAKSGEHPVLAEIRRNGGGADCLSGVAANVDGHGLPAVAEALETLLATLIEVLGSLVGDDMVLNLLDLDGPVHHESTGKETQ